MKQGRNTDAVSPVVGVMLMLAVTVMIAAVVSTYSGGFSDGAEKSPQSSLRAFPDLGLHRIYFEHNGGDTFTISSVSVVLREGDNKTSLSVDDVGSSRLVAFGEVGAGGSSTDTAVKAGDTFFIEGRGTGSDTQIRFGNMLLVNDSKITWLVVDKKTSKTISMGEFFF